MFKSNRRGNGYVELAVVVAILLVITLFAIPRYQDLRRDAKVAQLNNDTRILTTHVLEEQFNDPEGEWPVTGDEVTINGLKAKKLDDKIKNKVNSKVADEFYVVIEGNENAQEGDVVIQKGIINKDAEGNDVYNFGSNVTSLEQNE